MKRIFPWNWKSASGLNSIGSTGGISTIEIQGDSIIGTALRTGYGLSGSRLSYHAAMKIYKQSAPVATSVDMIAEEVEHIEPVLRMPDGTLLDEHEVLDFLGSPNDFETWSEMVGGLARHYLLTHDAFPYAEGIITRPPLSVFAVKPQQVNAQQNFADKWPQDYTIYDGIGAGTYTREHTPDGLRFYTKSKTGELLQINGFMSDTDNVQSDSPLMAICLDIFQQVSGKIHNVQLLKNGARPTLLVQFKDRQNDDEHKSRKQALEEQVSGSDNAGKIISVSSADMEVKELGQTNRDMDFANMNKVAENSVYLRYGIPLSFTTTDASTFNNMGTSTFHFYDRAVLPVFDKIMAGLGKLILPRFGLDEKLVSITYNPESITALRGRLLEELETRKKLGIETIDEMREGLPNRGPVEGGSTLYQPANLVPVGVDISTVDDEESPEEQARRMASEAGD